MEQVIGEDDEVPPRPTGKEYLTRSQRTAVSKNVLRAKQRQALAKLLDKEVYQMKVIVKTYKTKPVNITAVEWNGDKDVFDYLQNWSNGIIYRESRNVLRINTLEGVMEAYIGDFIIKGLRGEFYPCKPDVFEKKYEEIGGTE